jgi:prefoldin alpha subunit
MWWKKVSNNETQKEDINALVLELSNLQSYAEALRQQIELSSTAIMELTISKSSLEEIKRRGGNAEVLVPIGAGNFIRASIKDVNSVIVNIGANVSIEKGIDIAISDIEEKIKKVQSQMENLRSQYIQVVSRIEELQVKINELSEKK